VLGLEHFAVLLDHQRRVFVFPLAVLVASLRFLVASLMVRLYISIIISSGLGTSLSSKYIQIRRSALGQ
jgi:hypothetical protein